MHLHYQQFTASIRVLEINFADSQESLNLSDKEKQCVCVLPFQEYVSISICTTIKTLCTIFELHHKAAVIWMLCVIYGPNLFNMITHIPETVKHLQVHSDNKIVNDQLLMWVSVQGLSKNLA